MIQELNINDDWDAEQNQQSLLEMQITKQYNEEELLQEFQAMEIVEAQGEDDYCQLVGLTNPQQNAAHTIGSSSVDDNDEIEIVEVRQSTSKV